MGSTLFKRIIKHEFARGSSGHLPDVCQGFAQQKLCASVDFWRPRGTRAKEAQAVWRNVCLQQRAGTPSSDVRHQHAFYWPQNGGKSLLRKSRLLETIPMLGYC